MLPTLNIIYSQIKLGEAKISSTFRGPDSLIVSQINRGFHKSIRLGDWEELKMDESLMADEWSSGAVLDTRWRYPVLSVEVVKGREFRIEMRKRRMM